MKKKIIILIISSILLSFLLTYFFFFHKYVKFYFNGNKIINIDVYTDYKDEGVIACYKSLIGQCEKLEIKTESNLNINELGQYKIIYSVKNHNKIRKTERIVNVIDNLSPLIESVNTIQVCQGTKTSDIEFSYSANDNYDKDINNKIIRTNYDSYIILEVTDIANNKTAKEVNIEYKDTDLPSISLIGESDIYLYIGSEYIEPGYIANDNCDGDITTNVKTTGNVDVNKTGVYKISYSVDDSSGNTTIVERNVYIYASVKTIYLTFDDGPSSYTNRLLDILSKHNVKVTFFVINPKDHAALQRAAKEGHSIGLHSYSHNYSNVYSSINAYFNDLNLLRDKVYNLTGIKSNIIRFPGGSSNSVSNFNKGIMTSLTTEVIKSGYQYFDWNVGSSDTTNISTDQIFNNVINSIQNKNVSIVLQHDTNLNSINAVDKIIEYGLSHGYRFDKLSSSSPIVHHKIVN